MTFDELAQWTAHVGSGAKITAAVRGRLKTELPPFIRALTPSSAPARLRLPSGEWLTDATRMTALKCQCLFVARSAFGSSYGKADQEFEELGKDVLFYVMRHAFNSGDPKGIFCCAPCTLSLLPLYASASFRWVDCAALDRNVTEALQARQSVFARRYPAAYAQWALDLAARVRR